jgi:hypothetical protein
MPGIGELIDGAMQQAAQWGRQVTGAFCRAPVVAAPLKRLIASYVR